MLSALSVLSACKKEERTKEELLQATHWKRTADQRVDVSSGGTPVVTNSTVNCTTGDCSCDDYVVFMPDSKLEKNQGAIVCPNQPAPQNGKWYIDQKDQTLIASELTGYSGYWAFAIEELSTSKLVVSHQIVNGSTVSTFRTTFSAQ
ncbi:hypothetical protein KBK19_01705 [Microvirga sp. STR05]|uniref:Lipocalin-like domain-containing protein n=1 Tax=Hymenobacter duratus TaxID=2771356 RepID=A0ABR8JG22_9BACT|nr:hypothetical protein [Hymenobacter duratus]MBD2713744.1 hypothetical protein [Hymenobacter duratus]MBR7948646.1 hypothetical protein [Microvirga sp. STR05]